MSQETHPEFSTEELKTIEKEKTKPVDALVVFGGGIVTDQDLQSQKRGKQLIGKPEQGWRLPLGAKLRVLAASELYANSQVKDIIFTGGPVAAKGGIEASEAQLMKKYLRSHLESRWRKELKNDFQAEEGQLSETHKKQIETLTSQRWQEAEQHILLEDQATNTIENFAHTVNFIDKNPTEYQNIALLSNNFHIDRIVKLATKMKVEGEGIGSEDVVSNLDSRYEKVAKRYFDPETNENYRNEVLAELEGDEKTVVQNRLGDIASDRLKSERRWSKGLDDIPEYWLPNIQFIENPDRLRSILQSEEKAQQILSQLGIENIETATPEEIQKALGSVERIMPPKEWEEEK